MAITLAVKFNAGVDENNKVITKSRTFSNINSAASTQALHNTVQAVSSLLGYSVEKIERVTREQL